MDGTLITEITERRQNNSCFWKNNSTVDTPGKPEKMVTMEMLEQGHHDDHCMYELVLNCESIPREISMQHLVENPKGLLEFARKKAKWKPVEAEERSEEGQLLVGPEMIFTPTSLAEFSFESLSESMDKSDELHKIENKEQEDDSRADNRPEQIRLEDVPP